MSMAKYAKKAYPIYRGVSNRRSRAYVPAVRQLASDVMYLKGLINSEPKYLSTVFNNNVDYNGAVLSLCDIPQGDANVNREGDRILPRYLGIHGRVSMTTTYTGKHIGVRVIIFRWWGESPNAAGVAPSPSEVIGITGSQNAPDSFLNADVVGARGDRQRRIEVLKNYYVQLDNNGSSSLCINENIEMNGGKKKEHMQFFNNTTAPPTSGGAFILVITDTATSTDTAYHFASKITFYDN